MLPNAHTNLIQQIHASGKQIVLAVTGGGSGAIAALLTVPGASASVLEAIVPYAENSLAGWLGGAPDNACSERTARAMAMAAFSRAQILSDADPYALVGIGATASLVSTRPKRGPHRVHVAWQTAEATVAFSCELTKGDRTRTEEEASVTALVLDAIADAVGIDVGKVSADLIHEKVARREKRAPKAWSDLLLGKRSTIVFDGPTSDDAALPREPTIARGVVFPGAFNPIHAGHDRMALIAAARYGSPVLFELSLLNVDKPPLDFLELDDRLQNLAGKRVVVTRAPTFVEKARLLPGSTFLVGADTISRIADPRYYDGDSALRDEAVSSIASAGCRFLVFGRLIENQFQTLEDFDLTETLVAICDEVPESAFRADISSTELRNTATHISM